ncbi:MAG: hypothetical protein U9O89_04325 [Thermoproteota archaeon]|nr:hypothetical protein [Thermoproteota archaeon]
MIKGGNGKNHTTTPLKSPSENIAATTNRVIPTKIISEAKRNILNRVSQREVSNVGASRFKRL